jgi:hypothetical protein
MKPRVHQIVLNRWPYGLEVRASRHGLVLQPRQKARADWAKKFRKPSVATDDGVAFREFSNEFDRKDWKW